MADTLNFKTARRQERKMINSEVMLFFVTGLAIVSLMFVYTHRAERHAYCMIECMGDKHTEEAYAECASVYNTYTDSYCEPLM